MRILLTLLLSLLAGASANASIIQIDYTGTYSGTITTGNPAISQFTTVQVDPTPFSLTFIFDTLTPFAYYSESPTSSTLSGYKVGYAFGSFFFDVVANSPFSADNASAGSTSQTIVDYVYGKGGQSNRPLSINVSHPDIPSSITEPFSILDGLSGSGYYFYSVAGNFTYISESYRLTPETIRVTVDGISAAVPEPSTWAMLLIGFAGLGFVSRYGKTFRMARSLK
ncbi:PEP-CTERM sorting domain-containing protein [Bradyrhizobium sp. 157]|uniref:PEP-CTERM sorting domain-containing protein n=1 Tax=Bradyrhizobium sp. 157 TaxID=2782631 RepID=UPI001FFC0015|nr:PEP-CTERM sorting domain-containing protein [Bradyrhizobium sp. 157]MCK1641921.1 PEP-CTERM sorting domain-containing protein [Bradyrhizobium sp. 157]